MLSSPYLKLSYSELSKQHGTALPLSFPSVAAEVNLLSLLALLNLGASFRVPLYQATGRGTYDNVRALVLSLYLDDSSPSLLSARGMQSVGKEQIASLLRVSLHTERPHPSMPAVILGELGGPMYDFVTRVTEAMNGTGSILLEQGYADLGAFVLEALGEAERVGRGNGKGPEASVVLERLVRAFPAFRDMTLVDGQPVYIFKKALFLLHSLYLRFSRLSPSPIPLPSTADLPAFADNVLPSMLVHLGIIPVSSATDAGLRRVFENVDSSALVELPKAEEESRPQETLSQPPNPGPTLSPSQVTTLRAAALTACDDIVFRAREQGIDLGGAEMTAVGLDGWLWSAAKKRGDWRALGRFVEQEPGVFF